MDDSSTTLSLLRAAHPLVFINPRAGGGRALALASQIKELFRSYEIPVQLVTTASAAELQLTARAAITAGTHVLFAVGGDGTAQALANAAYGSDAILGLLPAGGGNDFALAA